MPVYKKGLLSEYVYGLLNRRGWGCSKMNGLDWEHVGCWGLVHSGQKLEYQKSQIRISFLGSFVYALCAELTLQFDDCGSKVVVVVGPLGGVTPLTLCFCVTSM